MRRASASQLRFAEMRVELALASRDIHKQRAIEKTAEAERLEGELFTACCLLRRLLDRPGDERTRLEAEDFLGRNFREEEGDGTETD